MTALGIQVEFPLEKDGCKSLTAGSCPVASGSSATYKLELPILKQYPLVSIIKFQF